MDARVDRIERIVHDYVLGFHKKNPEKAIAAAYRRVFLDALQSVPAGHRPDDVYLLSIMARACEYAAMAMYIEHTSDEFAKFQEPADEDVYNWLIEFRRFVNSIREHWDETPPPLLDVASRCETVDEHATLLALVVEDVDRRLHEKDEEDAGIWLPVIWFKQIKEFGIALAGFWLDVEHAEALETRITQDSQALLEYRFLDSAPDTGHADA